MYRRYQHSPRFRKLAFQGWQPIQAGAGIMGSLSSLQELLQLHPGLAPTRGLMATEVVSPEARQGDWDHRVHPCTEGDYQPDLPLPKESVSRAELPGGTRQQPNLWTSRKDGGRASPGMDKPDRFWTRRKVLGDRALRFTPPASPGQIPGSEQ
jgi:hypothetical protein